MRWQLKMAKHQTFFPSRQESRFDNIQGPVNYTRKMVDQVIENRKEEVIALPPVRAAANADHQQENKQLSPLGKWQIQRCSSPGAGFCQEELVNDWLQRNHIRVVQRLPKMDPIVLTSRGTDVSKYFSFIHPPPVSLKVSSTENKGREIAQKKTAFPESSSPCPRLLRSQRSDRDAFALNPVIRVGGGYRRLSWKVLKVLPSIGQYDPDYRCTSCNARLLVTEKVTNSRGQLRTILATPKRCHKCGTPTMDYRALIENDLHESVVDTLHRGDSRFIVDHRRFRNDQHLRSSPKNNAKVSPVSSSLDWHDDIDSFRQHMSRQSLLDDDQEARYQVSTHQRSESGSSVFITEPGTDIDKINEPRDVRRAWDDGSSLAEVTKDYEDKGEQWHNTKHSGSSLSDISAHDNDYLLDFDMIEDYDPESGLTVRLCRKTVSGTQKATSYTLHGIQGEKEAKRKSKEQKTEIKERKHGDYEKKCSRRETDSGHSTKKTSKQKIKQKIRSHEIDGDEEEIVNVRQKGTETNREVKKHKTSFQRTDSFYTVELDRRDYVFSSEPVLQESDEDDVIIDSWTRLSEDSLSGPEFLDDSWGSVPLRSVEGRRPSKPSPIDQELESEAQSSYLSPMQQDGYLADSEENADLSSLRAQIQQARKDAKKHRRKKEEVKVVERKESIGRKNEVAQSSRSQRLSDEDDSNRFPVTNTNWDSEWDSDFSLHVQPLSDLSMSSSEDGQRQSSTHRKTSNSEKHEKTRKGSDKTVSIEARRKARGSNDADRQKDAVNEGVIGGAPMQSGTGVTSLRDRKISRQIIVKPIPRIRSGSESDDVTPRPRVRAPRDEDDLSESDLIYFTQQFQAPHPSKSQGKRTTESDLLNCKGIDCYRCGAHISECKGLCAKCGTMCQRPGGSCSACRDMCENCNKPRYKCTSAGKRLENNETEGRDEEIVELDDFETETSVQQNTERTSAGDLRPVISSIAKDEPDRKLSQPAIGVELTGDEKFQNLQTWKKERKNRAPTERKKKDTNNIKRVGAKRNETSLNKKDENELESEGMDEEQEALVEKPQEDSELETPVSIEDLPSKQQRSVYSNKSIRKAKPSKKIISRTVVYNEKERPLETKQNSQEEDNSCKNDFVVVSPTPALETLEITEELGPTEREEAGKKERSTEQRTGDMGTNVDKRNSSDDVKTKLVEGELTGSEEKIGKENEKEEKEKEEVEKKNVLPKVRGVMRVNAAFKERAELGRRLQSVLKEALGDVIGQADIKTRKDSAIDYLAQYRLVDRSHLEMYGRAFTLEDDDEDGLISYEQMLLALEGVPSVAGMSRKQLLFVLQVLELTTGSRITFKMFSVATALCEKVMTLDEFLKQLVEEINLFDLECKLDMFRNMFFVTGDYSVNYITVDQLRIELKAGGLNQRQEDHVIGHMLQSTKTREISFLDYMAYLPLFLSIHQKICDNALDMSRNKYQRSNTSKPVAGYRLLGTEETMHGKRL